MYFAPYFLIAFGVNFGMLAVLGLSSGELPWAEDARLFGCMMYSASVALVFALTGLHGAVQSGNHPVKEMASLIIPSPVSELQREANGPLPTALPTVQPRPGQMAATPSKGELVT